MHIPECHGPVPQPSPPRRTLPKGSWDTHFHVLGPQARFPYSRARKYTPPDAPLEACLSLHGTLGIDRGLVVHANTHGFDNSVDLDAVARSNGRYLAVVRLDASATRDSCRNLHAAGARGVRFAFNPQHGGTLDLNVFEHVLRCIEGLDWFIDLHFDGAMLPDLRRWIETIPAPVVIDHLGRIDPGHGLDQEPFRALAAIAQRGNTWIKITGADRIVRGGYPYADVKPFVRRLLEVAADRLLWGSDWPHTGYFNSAAVPDDGRLLDALADFVESEALLHSILVANPLRLIRGA
ncbi:MAG: amidohydrolase [Burkholderiales bacterium]